MNKPKRPEKKTCKTCYNGSKKVTTMLGDEIDCPLYPEAYERADREQDAEDVSRCGYCEELPDDCNCR